ncbi:Ldh family oxidoreductase [Mycobacterium sp. ITM-2016-00317]|uniref:Ldh family oxidoreductase n=1 Tax=Mycobacterium sp. ITM-2016-00317 TaxID=2099694 RepID=UPI00287FD32F|nr:Ldh family oxidoreductase [Mycobacterium sp. ITM-2016-00317]WNG87522.1 Ldh family oxidoreductase [Mycobacterium sp. ITM-2016-00317]
MTGPITLTVPEGTALATDVLAAIGTPRDIAHDVATHLVEADCVGHSSHGLSRLPFYVDYFDRGIVTPSARPEVLDSPTPLVSANWGFSHPAAYLTTDLACESAQRNRIGIAGLVHSTHLGRLGAYMERACASGCVALGFVGGMGGDRLVAPFGGRSGLFGTNPIAAGFPTRSGAPIVVDFSTASAPIGKVLVAALAGERMPTQSLVDQDGVPTDDPHALDNGGAMRTFGDHKGFGLAVLIELLGKVVLGSQQLSDGKGGKIFADQGLVVIAIAADAFRELDGVLDDAEALRDQIHAVPPAAGFDTVLAPGDPEQQKRRQNAETFDITAGAWAKITEVAARVGLAPEAVPQPRRG